MALTFQEFKDLQDAGLLPCEPSALKTVDDGVRPVTDGVQGASDFQSSGRIRGSALSCSLDDLCEPRLISSSSPDSLMPSRIAHLTIQPKNAHISPNTMPCSSSAQKVNSNIPFPPVGDGSRVDFVNSSGQALRYCVLYGLRRDRSRGQLRSPVFGLDSALEFAALHKRAGFDCKVVKV